MNRDVAEIFDTYVYTAGLKQGQFSFSTAVGFFKSLIGLIVVMLANWLAKSRRRRHLLTTERWTAMVQDKTISSRIFDIVNYTRC